MEEFKFSTIEEAVADLRAGKMIIAVDAPFAFLLCCRTLPHHQKGRSRSLFPCAYPVHQVKEHQ